MIADHQEAGAFTGTRGNDREPALILFGDSHVVAVQKALQWRESLNREIPMDAFRRLKTKNGIDVGDISVNEFLPRISQLQPTDCVVSMIGGSQYAAFGTVQHPRPFDFFMPDQPPSPTRQAEIIPFQAIQSMAAETIIHGFDSEDMQIKGDGELIRLLRGKTRARMIHVLPPPPVKDGTAVSLRAESNFVTQGIRSLGVSPPDLRLKFWSLQANILRKFCRKLGIDVLQPPLKALDDGFLKPRFHRGGAHANGHYGELVIEQIVAIAAKYRRKDSQAQNHLE